MQKHKNAHQKTLLSFKQYCRRKSQNTTWQESSNVSKTCWRIQFNTIQAVENCSLGTQNQSELRLFGLYCAKRLSNCAHECAKNVFLLDLPGCCLRSTPPLNAIRISDRAHCGIVLPSVNRLQKPRPQPFGPVRTRFHSVLKIGPGVMSRPRWEWWTTSKQPVCLHALGLQTHKDNSITGRAQIKITIQLRYPNYQSADCIS